MNYDYIECFRKAYEVTTDPAMKQEALQGVREQEAFRDFYIGREFESYCMIYIYDMVYIIIFKINEYFI